jgi:hypothetical protein
VKKKKKKKKEEEEMEVEEEEDDSTEEMEMVPKRGIRRCDSATCGGRRWNRDLNAAINIRANLMHAIDNGGRWHAKFKRPLVSEEEGSVPSLLCPHHANPPIAV